jgi:AcrR family transcriptional regulator
MEMDTKQKILETSRTLFYEDGYSNTTVRQIAEVAGISTSILFHHFINKRDIFVHIVREYKEARNRAVDMFADVLLPIDRMVLRIKLYLLSSLYDEKLVRLHVDEINENIVADTGNAAGYPFDFYIGSEDYQDKTFVYDEIAKYRYHYFLGAVNEVMFKFFNGYLPFDSKSIDYHIISSFNLFFNISINEIIASLMRIDRIMKHISFDGLNFIVLNDKISDYITESNEFIAYDQSKVVFINDIIFSNESNKAESIEWLKEKYDKVIILVKYYKLNNPVDVNGILYGINDFKNHVIGSYSLLKDKFANEFLVASFIDNTKSEEQNGIINQFENYGIDALNTLRNLNINNDSNDSVATQCAFIFY